MKTIATFAVLGITLVVGCNADPLDYIASQPDLLIVSRPDLMQTSDLKPVCGIKKLSDETFPKAVQWHGACSPKSGTCMFSYVDGKSTKLRMYLANGEYEPMYPSSLPHATSPSGGIGFILGTQNGFLVSTKESNGNSEDVWALRTDDVGAVQHMRKTYYPIDAVGAIATSTKDQGEWVATAVWSNQNNMQQKLATYFIGQVDDKGVTVNKQQFLANNGPCYLYNTKMAQFNGTIAILSSWSDLYQKPETRGVSVFLKHPAKGPKEVTLAGPVNVPQDIACGIYWPIGIHTLGGSFVAAWRDSITGKAYATRLSTEGWRMSTVEIHPNLADFVPIKDGYATVTYDARNQVLGFSVTDTDWFSNSTWTIEHVTVTEGPYVYDDGLNDGYYAIAWVDGQHAAHLVFIADHCE